MHVLVTGGAGFIGSHTVERLLDAGARVRVVDNFSSGRRENLPRHRRLDIIDADIRDRVAMLQAAQGVTHALHLAAQVSVTASIDDPVTSAAINVFGFLNVLHAAHSCGVGRFVYASSCAVYGAPADPVCRETSPAQPIAPYGLEKLINDRYGEMYRELHGTSVLGLRYFNVFGPRQAATSPYAGVISKFVHCARAGLPLTIFGDGQQTRDFVYVGDVATINALALAAPLNGICNVATGHTLSLLELIDIIAGMAGGAIEKRMAPPRPGDIRHSRADNARLREQLGFNDFTPVTAGIERLWRYAETPRNEELPC